jgi:RNA polymerase sigma-70 factor (ECF subfamily)
MPTDAELVARCLTGSPEAATDLFRRNWPAVFGLIRGMLGDLEDAKDVAQDTFRKTFASLAAFDRERSFKPWIMAIARNTAISFIRERSCQPEGHLADDVRHEFPDENQNAEAGRDCGLRTQGSAAAGVADPSEEDRVREARRFARYVHHRMMLWFFRHTDTTRTRQLRRALLMHLRGSSYADIAKRCGYSTADSARITLHRAVERALDRDAAAREEARTIAADTRAQYRMLGGRPSGAVRFLNLVDL